MHLYRSNNFCDRELFLFRVVYRLIRWVIELTVEWSISRNVLSNNDPFSPCYHLLRFLGYLHFLLSSQIRKSGEYLRTTYENTGQLFRPY